ncbi:MAG: type 1 glutamine amidotransferase domain-containing protein [Bergeyella sp.]|nr:type 1 glutamine amidotransferase domain-containing protein [Bergeyella sp.]
MGFSNILIIVTNVGRYSKEDLKTGLWLGELTHIYHAATEKGCGITIASPNGGKTPLDPESLKFFTLDKIPKKYFNDPVFRELLGQTKNLKEVTSDSFDLVYLAGGHGTMYDFPNDEMIQTIVKNQYENSGMVAAICHGVGGLLNVKLSNDEYLIRGKTITGFSWIEEILANRQRRVPFNLEAALKARGANYKKALIPMTSNVVADKNLITGQNPFSSRETAKVILQELEKQKPKR